MVQTLVREEVLVPAPTTVEEMVRATRVVKQYDTGKLQVNALRSVDLTIRRGEMAAIMGRGNRAALANDPPILLADEPTGRLDSASGQRILDLLESLQRQRGLTIVLVTHEPAVAQRADRVVEMVDGPHIPGSRGPR